MGRAARSKFRFSGQCPLRSDCAQRFGFSTSQRWHTRSKRTRQFLSTAKQQAKQPAITVRISFTLLLPSIYEVKAIAKLSAAIRAPGPTGEGKTVGPGRARSAPAARAKKVA